MNNMHLDYNISQSHLIVNYSSSNISHAQIHHMNKCKVLYSQLATWSKSSQANYIAQMNLGF